MKAKFSHFAIYWIGSIFWPTNQWILEELGDWFDSFNFGMSNLQFCLQFGDLDFQVNDSLISFYIIDAFCSR